MRRSTLIAAGLGAAAILVAAASIAAAAAPARSDALGRAVAAVKANANAAHFGDGQTFTLKNVLTDPDGTSHVRMHRYYQGLPVLGGDLVVHLDKNGNWKGASQTLTATPKLSRDARLSAAGASDVALAAAGAGQHTVGGTQLVVDADGATASLAYEVVVSGTKADGTPSELHVLVDANSSRIRDSWDMVQTDAGIGNTQHSGQVALDVTASGGNFNLTDPVRGGHKTYDLNHGTNGTGTLITSIGDNVFGNGTTSDPQTAGADAHYGAAVTWDYYKNVHGRNGIRNDGVAAYSRVHYSTNYVNAFWQDNCFCMTYGDGDPSQGWTPLTSLDVAGHEMSHGVTSNTAGLRYSGESGGLNEGTSDIFGTMVEFYANNSNDPGDYLIGEELRASGQPFRFMYNPSLDGNSASCWSNTVKRLDVHYSSGVANHFFFMLAEGSGNTAFGNSPVCGGAAAVTGIGRSAAEKIWYRALTVYMTSRTNYAGARTATLSAAGDLYGVGSTQYNTVAAAWHAVNVG
jgi:Zn-dependent metalloprotease